ncbi:MAG: ATPase domain-containing protein [Candidatus Jordarchaeaceae archaeon]
MELVSTGIPAFDFLTRGGFEKNAQVLLLTETGTMGEILPLQIMNFRLKRGDYGLILDLDLPPMRIREWLKFFNFKFEEFEKEKKFFLIDGFTNLYEKLQSEEEFIIDDPRDILHLNAYLHGTIRFMREYGHSFNVCYLSNIMLSKGRDVDKIINWVYKSKILLSEFGTSFFVFNKSMLDNRIISTLKHIFDYVIELKILEVNNSYKRFLRVSKSSTLDYVDDLIPYNLGEKGIELSTEIMEEFHRMKQHLKMPERGIVELLGARVIISETRYMARFIKSMIEKYGYEKTYNILYNAGKQRSRIIVEEFMRQFKPSTSEAIPMYTRFNSLRGFGQFIGELDDTTNMLHTKHLNSPICTYFQNFGKPMGFWFSGIISGIYEILTGRKCSTQEVKCVAKGDEYCEHETKPEVT